MFVILNGKAREFPDPMPEKSLLNWLREDLGLTGTKNGCGQGTCGACVVLLDGKALQSCRRKAIEAHGKTLLTIEGMEGSDGSLHPIQQAFLDHGAIQCGFCTPGMVLRAKALLDENPIPTRDHIRKAIQGHICRCTGYQQIIDAIESASSHRHGIHS